MTIHLQEVLALAPARADEAGAHIAAAGARAVAGVGGRLFGVFRGVIGLSHGSLVAVTAWTDEAAALRGAGLATQGIEGIRLVDRDLWEPTSRPLPGAIPRDKGGYYSHRAFDILEADWPRFRELSEEGWGNFEESHATRVAGFWVCRSRPAPRQLRIRLMAWYESLDAWERSRWWNPGSRKSDTAFARFRERGRLLQDTSVSILTRYAQEGEAVVEATEPT